MESFRKLVSRFFGKPRKISRNGEMIVTAVITRADGTVENLGLITKGYIKDWNADNFIPSEVNDGNSSN